MFSVTELKSLKELKSCIDLVIKTSVNPDLDIATKQNFARGVGKLCELNAEILNKGEPNEE